jgi:hypothetical protein
MSYQLKVIQDSPIGFWPLDESSGTIAADRSGCGNNGAYVGTMISNMIPLIPGGQSGTKITNTSHVTLPILNNYYGATTTAGMATKYTSDNDFTLEVWISPQIYSTSITPLLADVTNNIGLFWENGDIVFKVDSQEVRCPVTYSKKSLHLVGLYTTNSISIYIDGVLASSKSIVDFKFTNTNFSLNIGPTTISSDSFIVDAPAVYRYSLPYKSILKHHVDGSFSGSAIQVVFPDEGVLFSGTDAYIKSQFEYTYPIKKQWEDLVDENTYYDPINKYISFYPSTGPKTFVYEDSFLLPSQIGITTSKIEWRNDLGISVESSSDGTNYTSCVNGEPLPQYKVGSFSSSGTVYFRITMTTSDSSKFLPRLSFFSITFYANRTLYADNYGDSISSTSNYNLGALNYPVLSRNYMGGIRPENGTGFDINTLSSIKSLEMIYTPIATGVASTLIHVPDSPISELSWTSAGVITKTNISKIYINNVDISAQANISNYLVAGQPHHIVVVFTSPVSTKIKINYKTSGGSNNLYKNIALYQKEITQAICAEHYNLYTGRPSASISESVITLTDPALSYYNNDWVVIQSV